MVTLDALRAVPRVVLVAVTSVAVTLDAVTLEPVGMVTAVGVLAVQLKDRTPLVTDAPQDAAVPAVRLP